MSFIGVGLLIVLAMVLHYVYTMLQRPGGALKGPFLWPVLYRLPNLVMAMKNDALFSTILDNFRQHGLTYSITLPGRPWAVDTADAAVARHILSDNFKSYSKPTDLKDDLKELMGHGIFAVDGVEWSRQRKAASHMFKISSLRQMVPVFERHALELTHKLELAAASGDVVDLQDLLQDFTLASTLEILFGVAIDPSSYAAFHYHFNKLQEESFGRVSRPFYRFFNSVGLVSRGERELKESSEFVRDFARKIIEVRKEESQESLVGRGDLLSRYLVSTEESPEMLNDVLRNLLVAGRDTTAATLSFALYELSRPENAAVHETAVAEILAAEIEGPLSFENTDNALPYVRGVVNESLRMYAPVFMDPKSALEDDVLPNGMRIKAGTSVVYHPYAMGHLECYWEEPEEFRPERWTKGASANGGLPVPKGNAGHFIPFQYGPRLCLGMRMAVSEMHTVLIKLLPKFRFESVEDVVLDPKITLVAKNGVKVRVKQVAE